VSSTLGQVECPEPATASRLDGTLVSRRPVASWIASPLPTGPKGQGIFLGGEALWIGW